MKRVAAPGIVCVLLLGVLAFRVVRADRQLAASVGQPHRIEGSWTTEQEWIVANVLGAIFNMTAYARGERLASTRTIHVRDLGVAGQPDPPRFEVSEPSELAGAIEVIDHIWSPLTYSLVASRLLVGAPPSTCGQSDSDTAMLTALLDPRPDALIRQNDRLSSILQSDMRCGRAHVEAALLLGTLALREASGIFYDTRSIISRMTAHLAIALASGGADDVMKNLADAVLFTVVGRQRTAVDLLRRVEGRRRSDAVRAWVRALRLRNTSDWRLLTKPAGASVLERLELLRATNTALGGTESVALLESIRWPESPDASRIILQLNPTVRGGNLFAEVGLERELQEAAEVRRFFDPATVGSAEDVVRELNTEPAAGPVNPGREPSVSVIDWGTWAAQSQRHLMMNIVANERHLELGLGLKEQAREFRADARQRFGDLGLYPLAARYLTSDQAEYAATMAAAIEICRKRPDIVTEAVWKRLLEAPPFAKVPHDVPESAVWFNPFVPAGTAFQASGRAFAIQGRPRFTRSQVDELMARAPFARVLVGESLRQRYGEEPPIAPSKQAYGDLAAYDLTVAGRLARAVSRDPKAYVKQMEHVSRLSPDRLQDLAAYLADRGRNDDARRAYERWVAAARNEVAVSNAAWWLVRHYFETKQIAKAEALATRAADVHSYAGLVTRGDLDDWQGRIEEAERVYRTASERYDNPNELLAFHLRHGRDGAETESLIRRVFPDGMTRIAHATLAGPPAHGVRLDEVGVLGAKNGLRAGDIVVGVDGIRVANYAQYRAARGSSAHRLMRFILWRSGRYLEVPVRLRYGWVISRLRDYKPVEEH
jgi:tetratricopeptide (TPR) repeat protein